MRTHFLAALFLPYCSRQLAHTSAEPASWDICRSSWLASGLITPATRRQMLPWAVLCAPFLIMRLGSRLRLNGTVYPDIVLPKFYLDQIPPGIFEAFWEVDMFMIGAIFPFTVLTCLGLVALQRRYAVAAKPTFILALALIVAIEYYIPLPSRTIPEEETAFLDWLAQRERGRRDSPDQRAAGAQQLESVYAVSGAKRLSAS